MSNKTPPSELIRAQDVQGFDRWALPSFDEGGGDVISQEPPQPVAEPVVAEPVAVIEEVPVEQVTPLTLEELEAIRQDAYNEGFSAGERDGFQAGQLKAKKETDAALKTHSKRFETLLQALMDPIAEQDKLVEQGLIQLVNQLARQVIRRELSQDSTQIANVLREAMKLLPMGAHNVRIHINPQDFAQLKEMREKHEENWRILEDDKLMPGGCRVETEHSRIDASVETRLEQAIQQLFDQQREQLTTPLSADTTLDLDAVHAD